MRAPWRFFPEQPELLDPNHLGGDALCGSQRQGSAGLQDLRQLLETSAVFLMCMPLAGCCTDIYVFLSTVSPGSDGQEGE